MDMCKALDACLSVWVQRLEARNLYSTLCLNRPASGAADFAPLCSQPGLRLSPLLLALHARQRIVWSAYTPPAAHYRVPQCGTPCTLHDRRPGIMKKVQNMFLQRQHCNV